MSNALKRILASKERSSKTDPTLQIIRKFTKKSVKIDTPHFGLMFYGFPDGKWKECAEALRTVGWQKGYVAKYKTFQSCVVVNMDRNKAQEEDVKYEDMKIEWGQLEYFSELGAVFLG